MNGAIRLPFVPADPAQPEASLMPLMTMTLARGPRQVAVSGLLDTGAAVNVLPKSIGEQLGLIWEQQRTTVVLSGNLARVRARGVVPLSTVGSFPPVRLAFAWAHSDNVPLILGQANFFLEFDVCFCRFRAEFEVKPKGS